MPVVVAALLALAQVQAAQTSAVTATKDMYAFWCTPDRSESPMCKQRALSMSLATETDPAKKKTILAELSELSKKVKTASSTKPPPTNTGMGSSLTRLMSGRGSLVAKEYAEMKMAFCATKPSNAKLLCATAASQYRPPGASYSNVTTTAMDWYCGKASAEASICKRVAAQKKLRKPNLSTEERQAAASELKELGPTPFGTTQAIYADFCKDPASLSLQTSSLCTTFKRTADQEKMTRYWCGKSENAESVWCQRNAILAKLRAKTPSGELAVSASDRTTLLKQMQTVTKGKSALAINDEISKAKASYCASVDSKPLFCSEGVGSSASRTATGRRTLFNRGAGRGAFPVRSF